MNILKSLFTSIIGIFIISCVFADKGHHIKVRVDGVQDTTALLAYHFGNRQYIQDTVDIDSQGRFAFTGEERLDPGMYMIVMPGQVYFEVIVDKDQYFSVETKMDDFVNSMKFTDSPVNEAFYGYMRFLGTKNERSSPLRAVMQNPDATEQERSRAREELDQIDKLVKAEQQRIINEVEGSLFASILLAQQESPMPEAPLREDGTPDNAFMYRTFLDNFWKNVDFSDDRLLRTPIFHAKLDQYFSRLVIQMPDSIIAEADRIVDRARAHPEVFKYTVFYITNTFERSQIMGMDAVFVHMVENYYMTGEADWVTSEQLERITERAMALKPILIGKIAPDITMFLPDRSTLRLHEVEAGFTVLYFWDSECGHCKRQTPLLKEFYERMNPRGVEIFAVNTEADRDKWLEYVNKNELSWIQVNDPANRSGFRDKYDIWATPLLFLLDKKKQIIAKRLTVEQLEEIINHELQRMN